MEPDRDKEKERDEKVTEIDLKTDELIKEKVDNKRIRNIDKTKKRAAIDSVFDERTYFELRRILQKGILFSIEGIISAGKEANIYLGYNNKGQEVAIKIYKIDRNTSKWMKSYIWGDPRFRKMPNNIGKIIYLWASKEYKNLKRAYNVGLRVPKPYYVQKNLLIMDYIGFGPIPAPQLKDIKHPGNLDNLLNEILLFIKNLYQKAHLVHADLSEFNILYHNQKPVFIDISQAILRDHPKAEKLLARDIKNVFYYFDKFNIEMPDPSDFYYEVLDVTNNSEI
jgi:RIO kinase 1